MCGVYLWGPPVSSSPSPSPPGPLELPHLWSLLSRKSCSFSETLLQVVTSQHSKYQDQTHRTQRRPKGSPCQAQQPAKFDSEPGVPRSLGSGKIWGPCCWQPQRPPGTRAGVPLSFQPPDPALDPTCCLFIRYNQMSQLKDKEQRELDKGTKGSWHKGYSPACSPSFKLASDVPSGWWPEGHTLH